MGIVDVCNIVRSFHYCRPIGRFGRVYLYAYEKTIDTSYLKMVKVATSVVGYKYFRKGEDL